MEIWIEEWTGKGVRQGTWNNGINSNQIMLAIVLPECLVVLALCVIAFISLAISFVSLFK